MRNILQNIRHFAHNHTGFFILFLICVFSSSILIFFSFGAYQNFRVMQQGVEDRQKECTVYFYGEDANGQETSFHAVKKQLDECIHSLPDEVSSNVTLFAMEYDLIANDNYTSIWSRFRYRNGTFFPYTESLESLIANNAVLSGFEGISVDAYNAGSEIMTAPFHILDDNNQIELNGRVYEAKVITKVGSIDIPFPSVSDEVELRELYVQFLFPPSEHELVQMKQCFQDAFGSQMIFEEPEPYRTDDYSYYTTIVVISILIAIAASANIALLYQYILEKRKRSLAILMLCGCTRYKAFRLFMTEILLLTIITFFFSVLCYHYFIMPHLFSLFPYIDTMNMSDMYCRAFLALLGSCIVTTAIMCAKIVFSSSIVKIQKEGLI
ncbi:MAG: hypothetical protein IKG82_13845 [Oscillospiraceae bacterium]|nr:hypothetical protein [Oscillospiraceae bacterium]MBR3419766.1 hypothetical protein [Oscillospiraceae bacterium]